MLSRGRRFVVLAAAVPAAALLSACSDGTLEDISAGASSVAGAPTPEQSASAGPTPEQSVSPGPTPDQSSPSPSPPGTATPEAPAAAAAGVDGRPEATCALGDRLARAGIMSYASDVYERALEYDDELACAREGFEATLVARRESIVLEARARARSSATAKISLYIKAVTRDYTNESALEALSAEAKKLATGCRFVAAAAKAKLHQIVVDLTEKDASCTADRVAGNAEKAAAVAIFERAGQLTGGDEVEARRRDLYVTVLEVDPTALGPGSDIAESLETALGEALPKPGRPTPSGVLDRLAEWADETYEALDGLAKFGLFVALSWAVLLTILAYVPGLSRWLRWLSRTQRDAGRPDDAWPKIVGRWVARVLLAPLRAVYRPRFELPPPGKDPNA